MNDVIQFHACGEGQLLITRNGEIVTETSVLAQVLNSRSKDLTAAVDEIEDASQS